MSINNSNHPELRSGEVYISSLFRPEDYDFLPYKTKRKGVKAYGLTGEIMSGCFPVFVQESEMKELDVEIMKNVLAKRNE